MKLLYTILISLFFHTIAFAQNAPGKKELVKLFKSSINQKSKKSISVGSVSWIMCNQDSAYYKSDTIKLYNNVNYASQISSCCDFVNWTFYNKNSFIQSYSQICKEPASSSIKTDYYKITIKAIDKKILLSLNSQKGLEFFMVLDIKEIKLATYDSTTEITLRRVSTKQPITGAIY